MLQGLGIKYSATELVEMYIIYNVHQIITQRDSVLSKITAEGIV